MLIRGSVIALAATGALAVAAFAPSGASAKFVGFRGIGPHPYVLRRSPEVLPARVHGCPGGMKKEHLCVRWNAPLPHRGEPNPTPVCVRYEWVNRCTT